MQDHNRKAKDPNEPAGRDGGCPGQSCPGGKQYVGHARQRHDAVRAGRRDGQTATNENVYESLAQDAWFPALYADEVLMDELEPDFPEL